ncbi:MAG: error-prone DNA polymerase [Kangiellaceae bacterium]|nr:error-prone DNA polymerase [Kangiellaceae bacterium]
MNFVELDTTSNFSFLTGASHPEELVEQAIKLNYRGMAIVDECSLAGVVRAHVAVRKHYQDKTKKRAHINSSNSKACNYQTSNSQTSNAILSPSRTSRFKLIIGSRLKVNFQSKKDLEIILFCPCRESYAELSSLITRARRAAKKGDYYLEVNNLQHYIERCLCLWITPTLSYEQQLDQLKALAPLFPKRLWIGYSRVMASNDYQCYLQSMKLAQMLNLPLVAHNKVLMHSRQRLKLQHCLHAIKTNQTVQSLGDELISNAEKSLRPLEQLKNLYPKSLLEETNQLADLCHFSLDELRYEYPDEILPKTVSATDYLSQLAYQGAEKRWPQGVTTKITEQIEYELSLIKELQYEHYFLTVYDIVKFARSQKILCQGRGSAANSAVCYCLFITEVDPGNSELLFERFISVERDEPPDIDVDFEHQRREEVIQYIYKKYSRDRAALTATVITYRLKSAIRDVGKALGIDAPILEHLSKSLAWWDKPESLQNYFTENNLSLDGCLAQNFYLLVMSILRFPRHLSQHVGGFIITRRAMSTLVPVENATMADRTVIQWDKYDIEALGLLKIDVLGLGMLTMIRKCLEMTSRYSDVKQLFDIPKEDPITYDMLCNGDTVGVFQIESRAQMSMLPRLQPRCFYDLVIQIAIVRPGPIQGNMVHPFLKRRSGEIPESYPNEEIKQVLKRTLGVPIFQEQVIKLAMVAAGFSGGEADQLRRAMASWGRNGDLFQFKSKLLGGMLSRGYHAEFAERVFEQMKGFGSYGFPESHSASFAILAYFSSWLKRHHGAAFYCALLNSQPMGFYSPSQLVQDAIRHRFTILPVDIDNSLWVSDIVLSSMPLSDIEHSNKPPQTIRLGMHLIKGFNQAAAERIIQQRQQKPFSNIKDLVYRCQLNAIERNALVQANALPRLAKHRYQAQWQALAIEEEKPLLQPLDTMATQASDIERSITAPTAVEDMVADYQTTGMTLKQHPIALMRQSGWLEPCKRASDLKHMRQNQFVKVAGVVSCRQRPGTASGVLFLTLEDETGNMNVIVWKNTLEKFRKAILSSRLLFVKGVIERERKVVHVIAGHISDISEQLPAFKKGSRDFH